LQKAGFVFTIVLILILCVFTYLGISPIVHVEVTTGGVVIEFRSEPPTHEQTYIQPPSNDVCQ